MFNLKKFKSYKRDLVDLFLKNSILSKFNFLKLQNKVKIKKNTFSINTHYSDQLKEKRKIKIIYGLSEKKYRLYYNYSKNKGGDILNNLLKIVESRLDNLVYRSGFAATRSEAKQMICHGFINLNFNLSKFPSQLLKPGDLVSINFKKKNYFRKNYFFFYFDKKLFPKWIFVNKLKFSFYLKRLPIIEELCPKQISVKSDFISGCCKF